ncbi:hypothetical protein K474DRAFT_718792 [Panus rudis PR-1116 ss-1]|nr:hypothetical protein K474DRAFT_718792 [Panus rudis PR-1116 ss-1]
MRFALRYSLFALAFASSLTSTAFAIPLQRNPIEVADGLFLRGSGHNGHHLAARSASIPSDDLTLTKRYDSLVWQGDHDKLESGAIVLAKRLASNSSPGASSSTRQTSSPSSSSSNPSHPASPPSQPPNTTPPPPSGQPPPYTEFRISTQSRPNTPSVYGSPPPSPYSWTSSQSSLVSPAPPYSPPRSPASRPPSSLGTPPPYEEQPNQNANRPSSRPGGGQATVPILSTPPQNPRNRNPYRNPNSNQPPRRRSLSYEVEARHPFGGARV